DQNMYQCTKGLSTAEATANPGSVIIICAECADGHGGEGFYRYLKDCASPAALYEQCMATPQDKTPQDQWQAQIQARIQAAHTVIFVTRPELKQIVEDMKMLYAASPAEALSMAQAIKGENASVTVIPNGVSVIL
ncbi:MAG: lactate racemization operon protein LarA, partial [Firmicutes bacterium]|nr:lactate racemization operon protein LarA [Bacillota bacterium]